MVCENVVVTYLLYYKFFCATNILYTQMDAVGSVEPYTLHNSMSRELIPTL